MKSLKKLVAAGLIALSSASAHSALIDHGSYLSDTETGLDWLDVTETQNMSYQSVSSQLGSGQAYDGWRYATSTELNLLVGHSLGLSSGVGPWLNTPSDPGFNQLMTNLGITQQDCFLGLCTASHVKGLVADDASLVDILGRPSRWVSKLTSFDLLDSHTPRYQFLLENESSSRIGSFLIRDSFTASVPEPGTISLLGLGLLGLGLSRKRKVS